MEQIYREYNYPSLKRFSEILKEKGLKKSQKEVKDFIETQKVGQLHKPVQKVKRNLKHITSSSPDEIWQIDLLDYQKYSRQNRGFKYIFICVDVFTRQARAEPIKNKTSTSTDDAFKKITKQNQPQAIYSDDGNEWKGEFKDLLKDKDIIHIVNDYGDHNSLGIIDRFSRTIKTMIAKYMTANETKKWIDVLPRLIELYNRTPHSGIENIKPEVAGERENIRRIGTLNFEKREHNNQVNKKANDIKVGDHVRVQRLKGTFEKGYTITYTKEVYKVVKTTAQKAELDNGKSYKKNKLMKVGSPEGIGVQRTGYTPPQPLKPAQPLLRYVRKPTVNFFDAK
jgi:hypothetical protein